MAKLVLLAWLLLGVTNCQPSDIFQSFVNPEVVDTCQDPPKCKIIFGQHRYWMHINLPSDPLNERGIVIGSDSSDALAELLYAQQCIPRDSGGRSIFFWMAVQTVMLMLTAMGLAWLQEFMRLSRERDSNNTNA